MIFLKSMALSGFSFLGFTKKSKLVYFCILKLFYLPHPYEIFKCNAYNPLFDIFSYKSLSTEPTKKHTELNVAFLLTNQNTRIKDLKL